MLILTIRTDKPEAEISLFENDKKLGQEVWMAHRELGRTINEKIAGLLKKSGKEPEKLEGIICFKGPGSFTGLRIGLTVGNTFAYSLSIPIVACDSENWQKSGIEKLLSGENETIALPEYGEEVHITPPKK